MSKSKTFQTEVAYDSYVAWIAEHIPGMLEVIGGGPAGLKTLATVAKASTPEQRARMLKGLAVMANFAEKGKTIIAEASH